MTPCDLVLAAVLITAPPGTPELPPSPDRWAGLQGALHKTAIEWEILDERETRYVLARPDDYEPDLNLLRRRYVDLADAPKVADSGRLPDRQAVNEFIRFNRAYRKNLETRQVWETDRADVIRIVVLETDRLYKVWDAVRDARCEFYYVTVRRQALKKLKETLGPDAYAAGDLPPYVPEWRFTVAR
ncbi:MAG: hypothetical protein JWO38_5891 [Gemmataceae bacterium]|nr:hypothetical protein [Gemmataceae bacterium]